MRGSTAGGLQNSFLPEARCPYCDRYVFIEDGGREEEDSHEIGPAQALAPDRTVWGLYRLVHHVSRRPYEGWARHEWLTEQEVMLRQVRSLHLHVLHPFRPGRPGASLIMLE